ncbi:hypothetical protein [Flavobacterium terrisoli]|uniref:hypothetical protein n=1 Tax=Flavobacterium terrisoli TaxID=3242195 RepID=UPI0025429254|nr:hypothetical protein [Flavobacterium buctense]
MKKLFIICVLFIATGCMSKLKVVVEVADRDKIITESGRLDQPNVALSINSLQNFITEWDKKHKDRMSKLFSDVKTGLGVSTLSPAVIKKFTDKIDAHIENIKTNKEKAEQYYNTYLGDNKKLVELNAAKLYVEKGGSELEKLEATLKDEGVLNAPTLAVVPESREVAATVSSGITALANNGALRTRFPILGDELVWFISKNSDKDIWKSVFNKTACANFMGNADMAMILRSTPPEREIKSGDYNNNFTIKGVRLDAADATNALVTGLTQTFNFIAATQGIPSVLNATPQTGTADNPLPNGSTAVNTIYDDQFKIETDRKKLEKCKELLIQKIKQEKFPANQTDADARAAANRIKKYWDEIIKIELQKT